MKYKHRYMPDHPMADTHGCVLEHRLVVEEADKCHLLPWAAVHHINGDKQDNRRENLLPMMKRAHGALHVSINIRKSHKTIFLKKARKWYIDGEPYLEYLERTKMSQHRAT